jgi:hypothetical protein
MQIETLQYQNNNWIIENKIKNLLDVNLVTIFGQTQEFINQKHYKYLKNRYPNADIVGCSSSGNIKMNEVCDSPIVATAISFLSTKIILKSIEFSSLDNIEDVANDLAQQFKKDKLKHIFILSDGLNLKGTELVKGFTKTLNIPVTGGLAGDDYRFEQTYIIANDIPKQNTIVAVGFYGDNIQIGSGCFSGWKEFGPLRVITKSKENIIYELDNKPALELYKKYLGEYSKDLPGSALRFPLSVKNDELKHHVVRALLGINEDEKSIILAGDIAQGSTARLMKPNIDLLIEGAGVAANDAKIDNNNLALGLVVSCVGRKIVLGQLIDEELDAIKNELGENVVLTGFYSYGEIAPFKNDINNCQLLNHTMTITTIYEKDN